MDLNMKIELAEREFKQADMMVTHTEKDLRDWRDKRELRLEVLNRLRAEKKATKAK